MKLKKQTRCAIAAVKVIARGDGPVPVKVIKEETGYEYQLLCKICQNLLRGGILRSYMGPKGGYKLANSNTHLLDILTITDGTINFATTGIEALDKKLAKIETQMMVALTEMPLVDL